MIGTAAATESLQGLKGPDERSPPGSALRDASGRLQASWLGVQVNGVAITRPARLLRSGRGEVFATVEDIARWRVRPPASAPIVYKGAEYYSLGAVDGLHYRIDDVSQVLVIDGSPEVFSPTVIDARPSHYPVADRGSTGAFLNYDLQFSRQDDARRLDGLFELGLFNGAGFGTSTFLGHTMDVPSQVIRLDTVWVHDEPESLRSLRLGDSIGRPGSWGRSVRFGGVQWGTDFTTRPDFVPFPLPTASGVALQPSTVDLYIDNVLRMTQKVPYGPFTLPNVPAIVGAGQVRLVVRDPLGRETLISQPYYVSNTLLRNGLEDYTAEAGFVRRRYALQSNDYGPFFATGTYRYGLSDDLTGEARAELLAATQGVGAGATWSLGEIGTANAAAAVSHSPAGWGWLTMAGIDHQARRLGFGLQTQWTSSTYSQLGYFDGQQPPRLTSTGRITYSLREGGSLFLSYVNQANRTQPSVKFVSAGYNTQLAGNLYVSLFALHSLTEGLGDSVGVSLNYSLGPRTSASLDWTRQDGTNTPTFQVQQSLPAGTGWGYRAIATGGPHPRNDAALMAQNDVGTYSVEVARAAGTTGERIAAAGGISLVGGGLRLSRRLDDSFAVVKVGDYPDVPIFLDNQRVATTDATGTAVVTPMRAYQENHLSIQQDALPLDVSVGMLRLAVTLSRRSAMLVAFPVQAAHGALLRLILDDGSPVPAGAVVTLPGKTEEFPVALRGEAYVTGLNADNALTVSWKGRSCTIQVKVPKKAGPLPTLGPFRCSGVQP